MLRIHLASGPIQTGKTTRLLKWCTGRVDVDGLLAPIVDGRRHLVRISTGDTRDLQQLGRADTPVTVGPYTFSDQVFAWGRAQLAAAHHGVTGAEGSGWLVIDEYGKLELRGEGLEPTVSAVVSLLHDSHGPTVSYRDSPRGSRDINLLLVIREGLVEPSLQKLGLSPRDVETFDLILRL